MKVGWRDRSFWMAGTATVCLVVSASAIAVRAHPSAQAPATGQAATQQAPVMAESHFKNIQILKGMPVDTFIEAMGMFAASMGGDCTYCHSKDAVFNRDAFSVATPRIQRPRQMIVTMNTITKRYVGGQTNLTGFT